MAKFLTDLVVKDVDDDFWELTAELIYDSDIVGKITVPAGFNTDFASVPRVPLAYWLVGGTADKAAVIHDYLYQMLSCTRKQADDVLLEAMGVCGVAAWRRRLIYAGVRIGGWYTWWKYSKAIKK